MNYVFHNIIDKHVEVYLDDISVYSENTTLHEEHVAGGFWAVILSQAAWKRSWVGHDSTQSKMVTDRSVDTTRIAAQAQLLIA